MKGWDESHIERLRVRGMVVDSPPVVVATPIPVIKSVPKEEPKPLREMKQVLKFMQIDFVTEYKFLNDRKFRFDIAKPEIKLAIEYEGLFSNKSRHTTDVGYSNDTEKYNLAVMNGWRVLRYTQLTYKRFVSDIKSIMLA